jgi:Ca-activated chloride channel family protein
MKGSRRPVIACAAALAAILVHGNAPAQDPPPTFRSGAAAVTVDANVRNARGGPITGLTAADFEILDNGVPQRVDDLSYGRVPIDITVALDVSYSVTGQLLEQLRRAVTELMRDLRPEDRLRLMLFNMRVSRVTGYTTDVKPVEQAIKTAAAGGGTALLDAVSVALVDASPPDRRQLVVFFTDGSDSSSVTSRDTLSRVAQRARATLTFVMPGGQQVFTSFSGVGAPMTTVRRIGAVPPQQSWFGGLARETGGSVLPVGDGMDLTGTFRRVLNDFRSAYVLYYTARGVEPGGYHTIEVRVKRDGAQVQARRGYFAR